MLHGFFAFFSGVLDWIVLILVWFERSLHSAHISGQSCPWTWNICTGGYRRLRGKWFKLCNLAATLQCHCLEMSLSRSHPDHKKKLTILLTVFTSGSVRSKSSLDEDTDDGNSERSPSQGEVVNKAERHAGESGVTLKLSSVSKKKDPFLLRSHRLRSRLIQVAYVTSLGCLCPKPASIEIFGCCMYECFSPRLPWFQVCPSKSRLFCSQSIEIERKPKEH